MQTRLEEIVEYEQMVDEMVREISKKEEENDELIERICQLEEEQHNHEELNSELETYIKELKDEISVKDSKLAK